MPSALFAVAAAAAMAVQPAMSAPPVESPPIDAMTSWYIDRGVDPDVATHLVSEFEAGTLPLSMTDAAPVRSETTDRDGYAVTLDFFSDGSVSETGVQMPTADASGIASPTSVGDCARAISGSGYVSYYECRVYHESAGLIMSFVANYTHVSNGVGIINDVSSPYAYVRGGTAETPVLTVGRSQSVGSSPAEATATTQINVGAGSSTARLTLNVRAGVASSSANF